MEKLEVTYKCGHTGMVNFNAATMNEAGARLEAREQFCCVDCAMEASKKARELTYQHRCSHCGKPTNIILRSSFGLVCMDCYDYVS